MEAPRSFGRDDAYRVVSVIGRGGFATVYKAYQASLDRHVAIKVVRPELVEDERSIQRFQREARAAARLSAHPNIVTIHDCDQQDGRAYLVLEFIDGTTLERRLQEPISVAEIERIITAIGSALDYAHSHQLVHRDVKPANVLLGNDGGIFLSDFGIAKLLDAGTSITGSVMGTVSYMAPEQIVGGEVDGRCDVYAFGAMAYRIFAGHPPFEGSLTSVLYKHVNEAAPRLVANDRLLPPAVEPIVLRALAKEPADRQASAGQLAAELSTALRPAILLERVQAALAQHRLGEAETLTSELLGDVAADPSGRYMHGEARRLYQIIQVTKLLEGGNWQSALQEIDRLRLREVEQAEEVVRRAEEARDREVARIQAEQRVAERQRQEAERQRQEQQPETRSEDAGLLHGLQGQAQPPAGIVESGAGAGAPSQRSARPAPAIPPIHRPPLPAVQPSPGAGRPRRSILWLGLVAMLLVIIGGLVGTRLLGGAVTGFATETPTPVAGLPTATLSAASQPTLERPVVAQAPSATPAPAQPSTVAPTSVAVPVSAPAPTSGPTAAAAPPAAVAPTSAPAEAALAPPLSVARHLHTATRLENGKILVVGGRDGNSPLDTAELYDPGTNSWTSTARMGTARYRHTASLLPDGSVLITGGQSGDGNFLDTAERYDPSANTWASAGKMSVLRAGHTQTVLENGKLLIAGGYNARQFHKSAELYDPAANTWGPAGDMADVHSGHTATRLPGGQIMVAGGFGTTTQATVERYDPSTNAWTPAASMNEGRLDHTATLLPGGKVLIAGGVNSQGGGTYLASAEVYNPAANTWVPTPPMSSPHSGHTAEALPDGKVVVAGGRDATTSLSSAERYDPGTNSWSPAGTLAAARWLPASALLPDGRVLLTGGRVGNSSLAFVEHYDPDTNDWTGQGQTITLNLTSQNNSGITGTATLTNIGGGRLRVEMHANGATAGPYPAHIHEGSCAQLNPAPRFPLTNVVNGLSLTDLASSLQQVTSAPHAIHMHKSPQEMAIYVACADTLIPN